MVRSLRFVAFGVIILAIVLGAGAIAANAVLKPRILRDLHADLAWTYVDGPVAETTRAYRWYPLTYPALETWTMDDGSERSEYAEATIVHFGGPLARHWLDVLIDRDPAQSDDVLPHSESPGYAAFRAATGTDDPSERQRLAARAVGHLGSRTYDLDTFDERLLQWLGTDALPALASWSTTATPERMAQVLSVLPYDLSSASSQDVAIAARLRAEGEAAQALEQRAVVAPPTPNPRDAAVAAAVVRLNNGDRRDVATLRTIVDGDLRRLDVAVPSSDLLILATTFPNSRFARGCRDFDALRGGTYFGRDFVAGPDFPKGGVAGWRAWLATYPDHPGADDAMYWLGRTLQARGNRAEATWTFMDALERGVGDGDMDDATWLRLKFMLDTGATESELADVARAHPGSPLAPLVLYARTVRRARANDFRNALALGADLDLRRGLAALPKRGFLADIPATSQAYSEQRAHWTRLAAVAPNGIAASTAARDALASAWSDDDGWKIGYLVLFNGDRQGGASLPGDPDFAWPGFATLAQAANQNAQTIALAEPLTAPGRPGDVRKRNQRRVITALYRQQVDFPEDETDLMGPLPSLPAGVGSDASLYPLEKPNETPHDPFYSAEVKSATVAAWYARQTVAATERYVAEYPDDDFASTALLAAYEVTGRTGYLRRIIAADPDGARTDEARALLWRATTPRR